MKEAKLQLLIVGILLCVCADLAQGTHPVMPQSAVAPQPVSYSPIDAIPSLPGAMARTQKLRMACYPLYGQCTKDSDCCKGFFCRVGRVTAYCDYK
jgi:hypothetical protein